MLDDLRLSTKAMIPLVVMSAMFSGVIAMGAFSTSSIVSNYKEIIEKADPSMLYGARAVRMIAEMSAQASAIVTYKCTGADAAKCLTEEAEEKKSEAEAMGLLREAARLDPEHAATYDDAMRQVETIIADLRPVIARGLLDDFSVTTDLDKVYSKIKVLEGQLRVFEDSQIAAGRASAMAIEASARQGIWLMIGLGTAAIVLGAALSLWISLSKVSRPLRVLSDTMRTLAGGMLTIDVPGQDRRDEIGAMAKTVQVFKASGLKAAALEAEVEATRTAAEVERARAEVERARESAEDSAAIAALAEGLDALANGNLTHQITQTLAPKTQQLKDDFNLAAGRLRETMTTITGAIQAMTTGTGEISQAADDLSKRTEQQAASLEETAAALDEITATVRKTAEGASHAQGIVSTAKTDAERSSEIVRDAVAAMSAIETSAQQISQIISVIDEIAFQTNLLALNAGVEAARAGEAGRGFAVVASEVRALAQRSAEAAKEIKALISTSSNQVDRGVKLVDQTGDALQRIAGQVAEVYTAISSIAASAQDQATGLQEVNTAINQMDQVTQQNAAMVEQSTAASHGLAQETAELSRLTSHFKTGETRARPSQAAPSRSPASRPARAAGLSVVPHDGPRKAPAPAGGSDGWEEF